MHDGVKVLLGIAIVFISLCFLLSWMQRKAADVGRKKRIKNENEQRNRAIPIINQANEKYGTGFVVGKNRDIANQIFFDHENRKIFLIDVQGLNGIRDYSFFKKWGHRTEQTGNTCRNYIEIYTKDVDVPLIRINVPSENEKKVTYARLNALMD